jgi:type IV secretion system protein VirB9
MRVTQYTAILCTALIFGCAGHEILPPAIPESRMVFTLSLGEMDDTAHRHALRLPEVEIITPPPEMLVAPHDLLDYVALRKRHRHRPRVVAQAATPDVRPVPLMPQLVTFPSPEAGTISAMPTLPAMGRRAIVIEESPIFATPQHAAKPEKPEKPEKVVAEANSASLLAPTRKKYGRGGLVKYPYEEGRAYLILTSPDHPTVVTLPPGERLAVVPAMNPEKFDLGYAEMGTDLTRQEAVFIRPTAPGYDATTALVTKQGHIYYLKVRSVEQAAMMGVTWTLPDEGTPVMDKGKGQPEEEAHVPGLPAFDLTRLHTGYEMKTTKGSPPWIPVSVFDDGLRTVIKFKESLSFTNAPAVFSVHANGEPGVVEFTAYEVAGQPDMPSFYVVAGIWPRLILKGTDDMQVVITRGAVQTPVYAPVAARR